MTNSNPDDSERSEKLIRLLMKVSARGDHLAEAATVWDDKVFDQICDALVSVLASTSPEVTLIVSVCASVIGNGCHRLGKYRESLRLFDAIIEARRKSEDSRDTRLLLARALQNRATARVELGKIIQAEEDYLEAIQILKSNAHSDALALEILGACENGLIIVKGVRGERLEADAIMESQPYAPRTDLYIRNIQAVLQGEKGNSEAAIQSFQRLLDETQGDDRAQGTLYANLAKVLMEAGQLQEAIQSLICAIEHHRLSPGCEEVLAMDHLSLGRAHETRGSLNDASEQYLMAWSVRLKTKVRSRLDLEILLKLVELRVGQQDVRKAKAIANRGIEIYEKLRSDLATSESGHKAAFLAYRRFLEVRYALDGNLHDCTELRLLFERAKARFWHEEMRRQLGVSALSPNSPDTKIVEQGYVPDVGFVPEVDSKVAFLDWFTGVGGSIRRWTAGNGWSCDNVSITADSLQEVAQTYTNLAHSGTEFTEQSTRHLSLASEFLHSDFPDAVPDLVPSALAEQIDNFEELVVIPDGPLWSVPWDIVPVSSGREGSNKSLIDCVAVSLTPSISVHLELQHRQLIQPQNGNRKFGVLGVSQFGTKLDELKGVNKECGSIFKRFAPHAEQISPNLSVESLIDQFGDYAYLHLASHSQHDPATGEPSFLLGDPEVTGHLLTASIIANAHLSVEFVFLSACRTSAGELSEGEGLSSLARAFLLSGAKSVVASLWPIDDNLSSIFADRFYQHFQDGQPVAQALRLAKLWFRSEHRKPSVWAAFHLIGNGSIRYP